MVSAVRRGASIRSVAKRFAVSPATVLTWSQRAEGRRLDRVDFTDRPSRPQRTHRTPDAVEDIVLEIRQDLKHNSDLGEYGATAIHQELVARGMKSPPSARTIGRILERRGALDGKRRTRRPPPPRGWYLPDLAAYEVELDEFDIIEDLRIQDGPLVDVLSGISLHGGLPSVWPVQAQIKAHRVLEALVERWRAVGLPAYAQFDNDTRFQGAHVHPDTIGRVMRLCLSLGVVAVFAPPRETGFQATIENFNGRWHKSVWTRFHHDSLEELQERSVRYLQAFQQRHAARIGAAPGRKPFPKRWRVDWEAQPKGIVVYLRRTDEDGRVALLGHTFTVDRLWPHRLVRCQVDLTESNIRFFALRRREPAWQPILKEIAHTIPQRTSHK